MLTLTTVCHPKMTIVGYPVFRDLLLASPVPRLLTVCLFFSVSSFVSSSLETSSCPPSAAAPFLINGRIYGHDRLVPTPGISCYSTAVGFSSDRSNRPLVASLLKHVHRICVMEK